MHSSFVAFLGAIQIVYMLFEPDIAVYKERVQERIGDELFNRLRFFVHGQHNHEGS